LSCFFSVAVASTSVPDGELHLLQFSFLKITPVSVPRATFKAPFQEVSFISQENVHVRIVIFVLVIPCQSPVLCPPPWHQVSTKYDNPCVCNVSLFYCSPVVL
jgi:hypothetical protein